MIQGDDNDDQDDYVRIPKREYEAIKNRVSAIEKRISREFELVQTTKESELDGNEGGKEDHEVDKRARRSLDPNAMVLSPAAGSMSRTIQNKYERALEETEQHNRSTGGTDELAKRLGRDLKIRRSAEHKIMRSPSARKIGSIRRRSRDHKLNRTMSLNVVQSSSSSKEIPPVEMTPRIDQDERELAEEENQRLGLFYPRQTSNLKRGRPNTIQTGLRVHRSPPDGGRRRSKEVVVVADEAVTMRRRSATLATVTNTEVERKSFYPVAPTAVVDEQWMDAKDFFAETHHHHQAQVNAPTQITPKRTEASERRSSLRSAGKSTPNGAPVMVMITTPTPKKAANPEDNLLKTPMLPPKRAAAPRKTPGSSMAKNHYLTPLQQAQQTGRASIARIRSQNAGMVLAKARLFNDLVGDELVGGASTGLERTASVALDVRRVGAQKENRRRSSPKTYVTSFRRPQIKPAMLAPSPRSRGLVKTPGREQRATPVRALPRSPPAQAVMESSRMPARHF